MITEEKSAWTDEQIVEHIRKWAIEQSPNGYNAVRANRIANRELFPSQAILAARGAHALRKLLPLLEDENPNVRLIAAGFAYDAAPALCRSVLEKLMKGCGAVALLAWAILAHKNPDTPPDPELLGRSGASSGDRPEL